MKLRFSVFLAIISLFTTGAFAQADTAIAMITNSPAETFAGGMSGDGRFVVFESRGNIATENPRNADGNTEIFLFDYAQRRIFQITDTKSVLFNPFAAAVFSNIRVEIANKRPVISNDGRWIAFGSNATRSTPAVPDATNPGSFDGNDYTNPQPTPPPTPTPGATPTPTPAPTPTPTPNPNPLTEDANLEMWMYEIPVYAPVADLSAGDEIAFANLSGGTFVRVTNTPASKLPTTGTSTVGPFVADDNHDVSISDDGSVIAFGSTRELVATGNTFPTEDNDEIFVFNRISGQVRQVTKTPRGPIGNPIYNKNPTISGNGLRVAFASTGDDPVVNAALATLECGDNPLASRNEEIFYADLAADGSPTFCKQVTTTTPTNPGEPVNILDLGRRMSRDGRFIAFDSYANLQEESGVTGQTSFALYVFDADAVAPANPFRRIGPRSTADAGATGGDVNHYPGFTDYDANGTPATVVLATRQNIKADGTIPTTAADGLNPEVTRPVQIYSYSLDDPQTTAIFIRLTKFPALVTNLVPLTQPLPSNTLKRMAFNLGIAEIGTGNFDQLMEGYYLLTPEVTNQSAATLNYATGASRLPISPTAVPSPSPTATPTPTPTPSPTPTPTPGGSPSPTPLPSPTGTTPPAVLGFSPGSLVIMNYSAALNQPIVARTAVGSIQRTFQLPIELSGVTMTINGLAVGLKSVSRHEIVFVAPPAIPSTNTGTEYPVVVNNNGTVLKGKVTIVPTRPDIFTTSAVPGPGGRAAALNVVNRVHTSEPFTVRTVRLRGGVMVPTRLRLRVTGVANAGSSVFTIRIGGAPPITGSSILTGGVLVEPGVYTIDFLIPPVLAGYDDLPVVLEVNSSGTIFSSRLADTAPKLSFH